MSEFWNSRFGRGEYVYGTEPNTFFKTQIDALDPGKALFPGEGEGRNAVYAARQGWEVVAFDSSTEGKKKAIALAHANHVSIEYRISSYGSFAWEQDYFDCLVLIFAHMPGEHRRAYHQQLLNYIRPGGHVIMEAFSKEQINKNTGGPPVLDMLYSSEELEHDFASCSKLSIKTMDRQLAEGPYHDGLASVIQLFATK